MDIPTHQDLMISLLHHQEAHNDIAERFNEFALKVETFCRGGVGGRLFIESELVGEPPALLVRFAEKRVRFSFTSQIVEYQSQGVLTVHRVPQHEPFEAACMLGQVTFDRDGVSSFKQEGRNLRINSETSAASIVGYFLGLNARTEFKHPHRAITSC